MPRWLRSVLRRIEELAASWRVLFTLKARRELAGIDLGLDEADACDVLVGLTADDFVDRLVSDATGESMYLFKPVVGGVDALSEADPARQLHRGVVPRGRER